MAKKRKTKKKANTGKKSKKPKKSDELKKLEKELKQDTKSVMLSEQMGSQKSRLVELHEHKREMDHFFRRMVLRCMKCDKRFEHEANVSPIEVELSCPSCSESHLLTFKPKTKYYSVRSDSVEIEGEKD